MAGELVEHAIERAVVLCPTDELTAESLSLDDPDAVAAAGENGGGGVAIDEGLSLDAAMKRYARESVERHEGNRSAAARELEIGRNRLARLLSDGD
jgi:DNA-binding NtrC family response regulator